MTALGVSLGGSWRCNIPRW